jgi:creatinine amidohydrolase/Fe(II)-dependent formamide hydrolase-like protein/GNAT superfamily N-acetyltransferase
MSRPPFPDPDATTFDWQRHPTRVAVLPVGACEQHSHHLPLSTDTVQAEHFARALARALDAALLPALAVSTSLEHAGFRGSLTLQPETLSAVLRDLAESLAGQGFQRLVVLNGHGGNFVLNPALRALNARNGPLRALLVNFWEHAEPGLLDEPEIHAGAFETSIMLAIAPQLVRAERVDHQPPEHVPGLRQSDLTHFGVGHFSPHGVWGRPSRASAELGRRLVASIEANLARHVRERLDWMERTPLYEGLGPLAERRMEAADIAVGLALCRAAGWNQVRSDWELYRSQNPEGAGVVVRNGQVIGTEVTVDYQRRFAWIGMVLVEPAWRRHGIGTRLLEMAMAQLSACETLKLDATPAGRQVYLPLGFQDEYGLMRMEAVAPAQAPPADPALRPLAAADLDAVLALDGAVFGAERGHILRTYHGLAPGYAWLWEQGGKPLGYVLGRHGFSYEQAGPIVAPSLEIAQALLLAVLTRHPGQRFLLDAPLHDARWPAWLKAIGFREQRPYTRMFKGPNRHPGRPGLQYAILGPELG